MLVFVDASGDPGFKFGAGSSPYLVVTVVILEDHDEANAVDDSISRLRAELHLHPSFEFRFSNCNRRLRVKFLETVVPYKFKYLAIVLNKERLWSQRFKDKEELYAFASGIVFENAKEHLDNAIVKIDQSGSKDFRKRLARYLKQKVNEPGQRSIKSVKPQESSGNNLLQLADMICGAVNRSFGSKDDADVYRRIVRCRERRVQFWPK